VVGPTVVNYFRGSSSTEELLPIRITMPELKSDIRRQESHDHIEYRVERVQFETDRHVIVGNVTLPPEGYQSRFSDALNRDDIAFVPVVDAEVRPLDGGDAVRHAVVLVAKRHIRVALPIEG
jgi:Family of unknown function (DUF6812)